MGILKLTPRAIWTALVAMLANLAGPAFAQDLSPIDGFFTNIGQAITGTTGQAIALVGLCAIGLIFMAGKMNIGFALSICLGIVIVFGAATILGGFGA